MSTKNNACIQKLTLSPHVLGQCELETMQKCTKNLELLSLVFKHLKHCPESSIFATYWFYWFLLDIVDDPSTHNLLHETIGYIETSTNILSVLELNTLKRKLSMA